MEQLASERPRARLPRQRPNVLRAWFAQKPPPMTKMRFAALLGVTPSYVSQLTSDAPPWPGRELVRRIGIVTEGQVDPNRLAGYPPDD